MSMSPSSHKVLLGAELALLAIPVSAIFSVGAAVAIFGSIASLPQSAGFVAVVVALLVATLAFWSLVSAYWRQGIVGLAGAPRRLWWFTAVGAVYAIVAAVGTIASLTTGVSTSAPAIQYVAAIYLSGLPMLVPLVHLGLLRLGGRANRSMHATREDARA